MYYINQITKIIMAKDKTINLRVSKELYNKIKKKATENRETISSTTRRFIQDSCEIISDLAGEVLTPREEVFDFEYDGKAVSDTACALCDKKIKKGSKIKIQETNAGKKRTVCGKCE
ncbi:hypothetical protein KC929_00930 [Patescibacteria group bacterium]|nr:hypothetical protein [Patescibacteria group bacterium]